MVALVVNIRLGCELSLFGHFREVSLNVTRRSFCPSKKEFDISINWLLVPLFLYIFILLHSSDCIAREVEEKICQGHACITFMWYDKCGLLNGAFFCLLIKYYHYQGVYVVLIVVAEEILKSC